MANRKNRGAMGGHTVVWVSPRGRKKADKKRKAEELNWRKQNGPVETRKATPEELQNFGKKKPP